MIEKDYHHCIRPLSEQPRSQGATAIRDNDGKWIIVKREDVKAMEDYNKEKLREGLLDELLDDIKINEEDA